MKRPQIKRPKASVLTALSITALMAVGGTAFASGVGNPNAQSNQANTEQTVGNGVSEANAENGSKTESAGDQALQDAASKAAGINPSADNIDYNDQTGISKLDTGSGGAESADTEAGSNAVDADGPGGPDNQAEGADTGAGSNTVDADGPVGPDNQVEGNDTGGE